MVVLQQNVQGFDAYFVSLTPAEKYVFGALGIFDIYHSWYFNVLLLVLSLNIVLASIDRFPSAWSYIVKPKTTATRPWLLARKENAKFLTDAASETEASSRIVSILRESGFKTTVTEKAGVTTVFGESGKWNRIGAYIVHVALLTLFLGHFVALQTGFDADVKMVPGERTELPSRLDPALLSHAVLTERALQQHPSDTDGFTARALPALAQTELDGDRLRSLLTRLQRPDVDNLPALIVRDLDHRQSGGFGSLPIHGELRLAQLEECVRLRPRLLQDPRFVDAWLQRMEPTQDVDWRRDPTARAAELQRLWQFAQRLSPAFNSLKAHVLYHWLQHDLSSGAPDRDRFLAYVRLPRRGGPVAEQHLRRHQNAPEFVTPQQEFRAQRDEAPSLR